jgi:hypothetical protein
MKQDIKNSIIVVIGMVSIILFNIYGKSNNSILPITWTPIVLTIIIAGLNYPLYKSNFKRTIFYNFGLLIFNDFLIRSPVKADGEGQEFISLLFVMTFILSIISMIVYAYVLAEETLNELNMGKFKTNITIVAVSALITALSYVIFISSN